MEENKFQVFYPKNNTEIDIRNGIYFGTYWIKMVVQEGGVSWIFSVLSILIIQIYFHDLLPIDMAKVIYWDHQISTVDQINSKRRLCDGI